MFIEFLTAEKALSDEQLVGDSVNTILENLLMLRKGLLVSAPKFIVQIVPMSTCIAFSFIFK